MLKKYSLAFLFLFLMLFSLSACQVPEKMKKQSAMASIEPLINIKTKSSSYIYLMPLPKQERSVFIEIQNNSGTDLFNLEPWLIASLEAKSFTITNNIDQANLVLRANLLRVGKVDDHESESLLSSEFGNSAPLISLEESSNISPSSMNKNDAIVLDLQYFARKKPVNPIEVNPRAAMENLSDLQLLLLCNTTYWERYQSRIISIAFDSQTKQEETFNRLGRSISESNSDSIRGIV